MKIAFKTWIKEKVVQLLGNLAAHSITYCVLLTLNETSSFTSYMLAYPLTISF